jgi:hypothetical protein
MKRTFLALGAAALLIGMIAGPVAAAGVQRNQVTTNVYNLVIGNGHTWTLVFGCGGSIEATGGQTGGPEEDITATLTGSIISFESEYVGGWQGSPYSWSGTFPVGGGVGTLNATDSLGGVYNGYTATLVSTSTTSYANHGEFVAAMGGGDDAAHSCIGMPLPAAS